MTVPDERPVPPAWDDLDLAWKRFNVQRTADARTCENIATITEALDPEWVQMNRDPAPPPGYELGLNFGLPPF